MAGVFPYAIGELEGCSLNTGSVFATTAGRFDADTCRGAIAQQSAHSFDRDLNGTNKEVWMHGVIYQAINTLADNDFMYMFDGSLNEVCTLDATNGTLLLTYYDGGGTTVVDTGVLLLNNTLQTVDFHAFIDNAAGFFEVYIDGVLIHKTTPGDTDHGRDIEIARYASINSSTTTFNYWSECFVNDTDTIGRRLLTLGVDANGTDTAWNGAFGDIDEVGTPDDSDFIDSTTAAEKETFTAAATDTGFDDYAVEAVVICQTALADGGAAPQNARNYIDSNGSTNTGANFGGLTAAFTPGHQTPFAQDPDGPADWDMTAVNALEFGVESQT